MLDTGRWKHLFARMVDWDEPGRRVIPAWGWAALVALVTAAVFAGVRHGSLLAWDDDINLTTNPHLRALSAANVRWMWTDFEYMRRYVPLTWLGWAIEHALFGLTPSSCHAGNLLFHSANAALVFLLVRAILELWRRDSPLTPSTNLAACAAGALFWSLHPLRVEIVAWASGRIYAQALFFLLVATLAYLRAAPAARGTGSRRGWFTVAVLAYTASLLTHPLGFTGVAVLLVADIWLLRRVDGRKALWRDPANRAVWLEKIPFVVVAVAVLGITLLARFHARGLWDPPPTLAQFGLLPRLMQACYIWAHYVWRPLVPVGLAPVYTTLVWFKPTDAVFVASAAAVAMVTAILWWRRAAWPGGCALWLVHLIVLVPTLGLTEYPHYPSDRYSYLQGVLWAPAFAVALRWLRARCDRRLVAGLGVATLAALSALTVSQIRIWRNSETLFRYLYAHVGDSGYRADIAFRLGEVLRAQNRLPEAAEYYRETLRIDVVGRRACGAHFGLGLIARAGERNEEARQHYQASLRLRPDFAPAYAGLGELLAMAGQRDAAVASFKQAIALDPEDAIARAALARLLAR